MKLIFLTLSVLLFINNYNSDSDYSINTIPEDLKESAFAVIRKDERIVEKQASGKAIMKVHYVVTVLNENGKKYGYLALKYNKFIQVKNIKANIYDESGNKKRKIRGSEILDHSYINSYSLYEDNRIKLVEPQNNSYPYTVEYIYSIQFKDIIIYPTWQILPDYNVSLENGIYTISLPKKEELNYKMVHFSNEPEYQSDNKTKTYSWKINNLSSHKEEQFSKNKRDIFPELLISPSKFEYGGFEGNFSSWNLFGKWVYSLIEGKDQLTDKVIKEIKNLCAKSKSNYEKVKLIYKYMQNRVRYVNISVGIGGFEPIEAQRVHNVGYGDCKALTNYMKALLSAAEIESVYTLVNAGTDAPSIHEKFPSQQFNHVILMVPLENDSVWLECTSQHLPCGYLGDFTDDRTVLFVKKEGGELGKTPGFRYDENYIKTNASIRLNQDLNASIKREKHYGGVFFNKMFTLYLHADYEEQKRKIKNELKLSNFTLESLNFSVEKEPKPEIIEKIEITDDKNADFSGDYISYSLNLLTSEILIPPRILNREKEVFNKRGLLYEDSLTIKFPEYLIAIEPVKEVEIKSKFGKYSSSTQISDRSITYVRRFDLYKFNYQSESYNELYNFFREINRAENSKLILKKVNSSQQIP